MKKQKTELTKKLEVIKKEEIISRLVASTIKAGCDDQQLLDWYCYEVIDDTL